MSPPSADDPATSALRTALKKQYHAALAMLREAIERCPEALWTDERQSGVVYWQHAYHVLFFTHCYLQRDAQSFHRWSGHQANVQYDDGIPGPPDPASTLPLAPEPYTRDQVLAYWRFCDEMVDGAVDAMDLLATRSGFDWYPIPKLEHQLVTLRHLQHHTAHLATRLRAAADVGIDWVGSWPPRARRPSEG